jgi:hypothetical protein
VRESKRLQKAADQQEVKSRDARREALKRGLEQLPDEKLPTSPDQMESFFLEHVAMAEALVGKGASLVFSYHTFFLSPSTVLS